MDAWWDGEELSSDALVHHISHAMACLAIIKDAESIGMLNDDRPFKGAAAALQDSFANNNTKKDANIEPAIRAAQQEFKDKRDAIDGNLQRTRIYPAYPVEPCGVHDVQADVLSGDGRRWD